MTAKLQTDGRVSSGTLLEVTDLATHFATPRGVVRAVDGVSFTLERGKALGIVGESGSGKTILSRSIMGLLPVQGTHRSGSIKFAGVEVGNKTRRQMRHIWGKEMAMIFQDPLSALNPVQRIVTQITEMLQSHQQISKAAAFDRTVDLLDMVGIPQPKDRAMQYPHEFSGGMRQRVMIAMAIANDPKVLIADEPTTALDVTVQAQILELIQKIQNEMRAAVVLITHDLGVVARVADRVQVMYGGRVVERGEVHDLYAKPTHPYTRGLLDSLPGSERERLRQFIYSGLAGGKPRNDGAARGVSQRSERLIEGFWDHIFPFIYITN